MVVAGAALSKGAPSNLPLAADIQALIKAWLVEGTASGGNLVVESAVRLVDEIPLEILLEMLEGISPMSIIDAVLDEITRQVPPNANHMALAADLHSGDVSAALTTNFDSLIEDACARLGMSPVDIAQRVRHLHGRRGDPVHPPFMVRNQELRIHFVPEERTVAKLLDDALRQARAVTFIGYSGRDVDLLPHFARYCSDRWIVTGRHEASNFLKDEGAQFVDLDLSQPDNHLIRLSGHEPATAPLFGSCDLTRLRATLGATGPSARKIAALRIVAVDRWMGLAPSR